MLRIFIGYDERETVAYHVLAHSILRQATQPVSITPLVRSQLHVYGFTRPRAAGESTDFAYSRFMVPALCGYYGLAVFMDCDMLLRADICEVGAYVYQSEKAVAVCQHDYIPRQSTKFLGQVQSAYPRKNWSSFILFDTAKCTALTPDYVNTASPADLHRFRWLRDDAIGTLPLSWNYLVGEDNQSTDPPKNIHFTNGTPCFPEYANCDYADEWFAERDRMLSAASLGVAA